MESRIVIVPPNMIDQNTVRMFKERFLCKAIKQHILEWIVAEQVNGIGWKGS